MCEHAHRFYANTTHLNMCIVIYSVHFRFFVSLSPSFFLFISYFSFLILIPITSEKADWKHLFTIHSYLGHLAIWTKVWNSFFDFLFFLFLYFFLKKQASNWSEILLLQQHLMHILFLKFKQISYWVYTKQSFGENNINIQMFTRIFALICISTTW